MRSERQFSEITRQWYGLGWHMWEAQTNSDMGRLFVAAEGCRLLPIHGSLIYKPT